MPTEVETTVAANKTTAETNHPPLDPMLRVNAIMEAINREAKISPEAATKLKDLITKAIDERVAEMDDIRLGRVLGSALATL